MEPMTIAIISAVVFGTVTTLAIFAREMILSRDKRLNDKAQERALLHEAKEMEKLREQMESNHRFDSHYQVLGANKDAIQYVDQKIEEVLNKKFALIQRYGQLAVKESNAIISGDISSERKGVCDLLRTEIDQEIQFYNNELQQLQTRRASIWTSNTELQQYLVTHEQSRNEKLDNLYQNHSGILEKIYLRHCENSEKVATKTLESGTEAFNLLSAPWKFLTSLFSSTESSTDKAKEENEARKKIEDTEKDINDESQTSEEPDKKKKNTPEFI